MEESDGREKGQYVLAVVQEGVANWTNAEVDLVVTLREMYT